MADALDALPLDVDSVGEGPDRLDRIIDDALKVTLLYYYYYYYYNSFNLI